MAILNFNPRTNKKFNQLIDKNFFASVFVEISLIITMKLFTRIYQLSGIDFFEEDFFRLCRISSRALARAVFLLHVAFISVNLKYQYSFQVQLFKHPDVVGNITNLVEILLPVICHLTMVLEAFSKRKKQRKIAILIKQIRTTFSSSTTSLPVCKFVFLFAVNSFIYLMVVVMVYHIVGEWVIAIAKLPYESHSCATTSSSSSFQRPYSLGWVLFFVFI